MRIVSVRRESLSWAYHTIPLKIGTNDHECFRITRRESCTSDTIEHDNASNYEKNKTMLDLRSQNISLKVFVFFF